MMKYVLNYAYGGAVILAAIEIADRWDFDVTEALAQNLNAIAPALG